MRSIHINDQDRVPGVRLEKNDTFTFHCHPGVSCFNRCCQNLNLFLYPYDLIRLRQRLNYSTDQFIDRHVDIVLREGNFFPEVLLTMADNAAKTCPFLDESGCRVYKDRPWTCRSFPLEQGLVCNERKEKGTWLYFFRPPDFCRGPYEKRTWTTTTWAIDQDAVTYNKITARWARIKHRFQTNPWGNEGPEGSKAKMAFMATYNMDKFRDFIFGSSFRHRYRINAGRLRKAKTDDTALLELGFEWVEYFLWSKKSKLIRPY